MELTNLTAQHVPAVITTDLRGVFYGYVTKEDAAKKNGLEVMYPRMCFMWSESVRDVVGLAQSGPTTTCKIGPMLDGGMLLHDISGVFFCTPEATENWKKAGWGD